MADDIPFKKTTSELDRTKELQRRVLRESARDLASTLGKISGAKFEIIQEEAKPGDTRIPILVGEYATKKFGKPKDSDPYQQAWRLVVSESGIGFIGQSDESTSYAIYELLDLLGCRWFMPGELGEVIPQSKTIELPALDKSGVPITAFRQVWYADDAFKRRNRLGGFATSHKQNFEHYITEEQREQHPEWRATIGGKPHRYRLKWSNPAVADAVAAAIIAKLDEKYTPTVSLGPVDGSEFDETDDKAWDAGDWDPSMETISITDRYIKFCNLVAQKVNKKYPDVMFGLLAYVQHSRPPVREKPDPHLIPQICPITYSRAHAMTDEKSSRAQIRPILEGWARVSPNLAYYNYMFHLAETSVPYPMIHQMSEELPIILAEANHVKFWTPETQSNFDSALPGMWLALRLSWDRNRKPKEVLDELYSRFYGSAQEPMRRYWTIFDDAWTDVATEAGCGFSYLQRFTPERMAAARKAMDEALAAANSSMEYQRVKLFDNSLRQFERFMSLRRDMAEGRLQNLDLRATEWLGTQIGLAREYTGNYAFGQPPMLPATRPGIYFKVFWEPAYLEAAKLAGTKTSLYTQLLKSPIRVWQYQFSPAPKSAGAASETSLAVGEKLGWQKADFDDSKWKTTDPCLETWFDLGFSNSMGTMWYRTWVDVPNVPKGKKVLLWIAAADNTAKLFIDGKHVPYVNAEGAKVDQGENAFTTPLTFDITNSIKPGAKNQISIASTRSSILELGVGGLLGPVYLFLEK